ncbi:MAG TPA: S41 family peptidase [Prolixibacteraceae bacterium]|nr:S41 family peptidase [Prolixibacteraceae bacterium]HPR59399.1 S41 family peptidase [Prolixibacteraceae bacterium]
MKQITKVLFPLLLAIAVIVGILLGSGIQKRINVQKNNYTSIFQPDKLSYLLKLIENDYVDSVNQAEMIENTIPELLDDLDPHSTYIPASEMKAVSEDMRGNFSGIGVQFVMQNDTVMIVDVISGGPSKELGIAAGDRIVKVNGNNIAGQGIKSDSIVSLLRGKKGTMVNISVQRPGITDFIDFDIKRGDIPLYSVDVAYMLTQNIGLIKVNRFSDTTLKEFISAMNRLNMQGMTKIVIDLRGNAGGSLQAVIQMVDEFLPANKLIVYTEGKSRSRYNYFSSVNGAYLEKEVAVLIDEFSASASEIFAGAIQDNDRGLIIGRRSFGKGLVQEQIPLFDGSAVRLTVARFYTPSGRSIQKPYNNGIDNYQLDFHNRLINNELTQKDSIHFADSLKYQTTGGRTVYGGGGIMPDFFIPIDTTGANRLFSAIVSRSLIYHFAFDYSDKNRTKLSKNKTVEALENYLNKNKIFDDFIEHIEKQSISFTKAELVEARPLLNMQLHAYIARNIMGNEGFYPVVYKEDKTVIKAIELLQNKWTESDISSLAEAKQLD